MKKTILGIMVTLLLTSMLMLAFNIKQAKSSEPPATEWTRTYGGPDDDEAWCVIQTDDGGYAILGNTYSFGAGQADVLLIKTDATGNMQWNRTYGDADWERGCCLIQTSDGGYAIACEKAPSPPPMPSDRDFWLVKTDADGIMRWNKTYGGTNMERGPYSLIQTSDGGYALTGETWSFGAGTSDLWLVKTDVNGVMQWDHTYGGASEDGAWSVVQTNDGGYALAGGTVSYGSGDRDFWLIKTDLAGNAQWNETYGGADAEWAYSVIQADDGGYALAGWTESSGAGGQDFWLIKLAPVKISATVDIDPNTLNLRSWGKWITAYIELPEGYNVADVNVSSILLNGTIPVCPCAPTAVGDYDSDGIPDLMVKFSRLRVIFFILCHINIIELLEEGCVTVTLTITGRLNDGTPFEGSDTIKIILQLPRHWRLVEFY